MTKLFCGPTGLRGTVIENTTDLSETRRRLHCAAFNALAAVLMATQDQEKFFAGFLFKENLAKGERLLDNIIDTSRWGVGQQEKAREDDSFQSHNFRFIILD